MNKIQRLSRYFCGISMTAMIVLPLMFILFWIDAPHSFNWGNNFGFSFSFLPSGIKIMHSLTFTERSLGFLISLIPLSVLLLTLYFLIRLFRLYAESKIFSLENIRYIKYISYVLLIGQGLNFFYQALITFALTWYNPPGHRIVSISISGINISIALMGLVILLVAWIMEEAHRINKDHLRIV